MAYVRQVGGDHYQSSNQHWDLMQRWDIEYLLATPTKYILRYDRKGKPKEDLQKALSYVEKKLTEGRDALRVIPQSELECFYVDNQCSLDKITLYDLIHGSGSQGSLERAAWKLHEMIAGC